MLHQPYRLRIRVVVLVVAAALCGLIARLYYLQIVRHKYYVEEAKRYQWDHVPILPKRGNIYDRNRRGLAISDLRDSLYVQTRLLPQYKAGLARQLAEALKRSKDPRVRELTEERIYRQLNREGNIPVVRVLPEEDTARVRNVLGEYLARPATFYFLVESKRHYPKGSLASQVLGFTTFEESGENAGLAGLEYQYDKEIRGNYQKFEGLRDALSRQMTPIDEDYYSAAFGNELILTIDESIQHVAEAALREKVAELRARCGVVIVQKCKTGEILAMASWPDFEPAEYATATSNTLVNRAVTHAFNMGSVMKVFTASALLETGRLTNLDELINCHNGEHVFPPRRVPIRDAPGHDLGIVPFRDVFRWSSNVGMVEAAQRMNRHEYGWVLEAFGFGQKTGVDLPGEAAGILRPVSQWTDYSMLALPYGAEMSVTPLQLVTAVSAVANGGLLMKPYVVGEVRTYEGQLVRRTKPTVRRRAIKPATAALVLELMEGVVGHPTPDGNWEGGTGKVARIAGYRMGGKTGTYKHITPGAPGDQPSQYTASFVGVLPLPDPELTIFCCIDEPQEKKYGADVAAPVVKKVAEHSLRILGIPPSQTDRSPAGFEMAVRRESGSRHIDRSATPKGHMPDLRGMTMREASQSLTGLNLRMSFHGSGVVVGQQPESMASLRGIRECQVVFGQTGNPEQPAIAASKKDPRQVNLMDLPPLAVNAQNEE